MTRQNKTIWINLLVILLIACSATTTEEVVIPGFDSQLWKKDSVSCNGYRKVVSDSLLKYKKRLLGKSREEIISILGSPNVEHEYYRYFIEKGVQCMVNVTKEGYDSLETASIMLDFNRRDKLSDIRKIIP